MGSFSVAHSRRGKHAHQVDNKDLYNNLGCMLKKKKNESVWLQFQEIDYLGGILSRFPLFEGKVKSKLHTECASALSSSSSVSRC